MTRPTLSHVWFGTILGEDNKAIKTRDGQPVKLIDLLLKQLTGLKIWSLKKTLTWNSEVKKRAKKIGLGAVRYADLSQDRTLDYVFAWEKMLAMQGNTAPYLQYAVARIHSIFRKAEIDHGNSIRLHLSQRPNQNESLRESFCFSLSCLKQTTKELKPHFLGGYLYELATEFSSFYNQSKVMVEDKNDHAS